MKIRDKVKNIFPGSKIQFPLYLIHPTSENPGFSAVLFLGLPVADPDAVSGLTFRFVLILTIVVVDEKMKKNK